MLKFACVVDSVSEMLAKYDVHVPVKDIGDKQVSWLLF